MKSTDRAILDASLDSFIWAAINRISRSGTMEHTFRVGASELNRERLHDSLIDEVNEFFRCAGAAAEFDAQRAAFTVKIDLDQVHLNGAQAKALATAMEVYRADFG